MKRLIKAMVICCIGIVIGACAAVTVSGFSGYQYRYIRCNTVSIDQPVAMDWTDNARWGYDGDISGIYSAICVGDINVDGVTNSKDAHEMLVYTTYRQVELTTNLVDFILHRNRDGAIEIHPELYTGVNAAPNSGMVETSGGLLLERLFDISDYLGLDATEYNGSKYDFGNQDFVMGPEGEIIGWQVRE